MAGARNEDYWSNVGDRDDEDDLEEGKTTVREKIADVLEADRIHGLTITRRQEKEGQRDTVYCVVSQSTTWDQIDDDVDLDIPVLDIRTVVVDLEADTVKVSDNGIWVPQEVGVADNITKLLARSTTDLNGGIDPDVDPLTSSAVGGLEPEMLLDQEIDDQDEIVGQMTDRMRRETGIDPSREWGYAAGPPPEVEAAVERLEEAGLDPSNHLTRLVFGQKEPYQKRSIRYAAEDLKGNYGIELNPNPAGLVAIDVDYPAEFPDDVDLPETWEISSPHGDDTRRHIVLRCENKDEIAEELGAWAVQSLEWGDLWIGDRYLVGPGSQLSEYGCDDGDHERGEEGGCSACEDPDDGYYEVVNDAPIATVDAETILELVPDKDEGEKRNDLADPDPPGKDDDLEDGQLRCDACGAVKDEEEIRSTTLGGDTRRYCKGGCDD